MKFTFTVANVRTSTDSGKKGDVVTETVRLDLVPPEKGAAASLSGISSIQVRITDAALMGKHAYGQKVVMTLAPEVPAEQPAAA